MISRGYLPFPVRATVDKFAQEAGAAGFVRKTDDLSKLVEEVKERLAA